jgi:hypothetical protein
MRGALTVGFVALVLTAGCGQPPQQDVDAAKAALDAARTASAQEYAPAQMKAAEDAYADLQAEMNAQAGKFALFRSYKVAQEKAAAANQAIEQAQAAAQQGKEMAKQQAATAIQDGRTALQEAAALLEKAPRGKGSAADLAALKADLDGAGTSLTEADSMMTGETYREAQAKAAAAKTAIAGVKSQIDEAMVKVQGKGSAKK